MALHWLDGFESYYDQNDVNALPNLDGGTKISCDNTFGRFGQGMRLEWVDTYRYLAEVTGSPDTIVVGFALKFTTAPTSFNNYDILRLLDDFNEATGNIHVRFRANGSGLIEARDSANSLLGTSSGHVISTNTWYFVEFKVYIHDSAGTIEVKVDGVTRLNLTSQDTLNGSNAYVGGVRLGNNYLNYTYMDDLYVCDTSGSSPCNDFLGDSRVDVLRPDGIGNTTQFAPSAGDNYENVDEVYPDDEATYNDGDLAEKDTYQLSDLSALGTTIYGSKSQITVRKTDAGSRKVKVVTRSNITDYLGDEKILSDTFQTFTKLYENNPDDAAAWEEADLNGSEVGVLVSA